MLARTLCLAAAVATAIAAVAATPAAARAPRSLSCNGSLRHAHRPPVLLVHGTFADSKINWSWNYKRTLPARGEPACTIDLPNKSAGDIQSSSREVVSAIRAVARRSGGRIAVMGLSQGGLNIRWALRWWPDVRRLVSDVITLAAPNNGSKFTNESCNAPGACATSLYQMRSDSIFLRALNSGPKTYRGIAFTAVATSDDTVFVTPPEARLQAASNIVVQDLCPGHKVDHVGLAYDGPTYGIVVDALDHRGPAKMSRIDRAVCRRDTMPGTTRAQADAKVAAYQATLAELLGPNGPKAQGEPPLARYARG